MGGVDAKVTTTSWQYAAWEGQQDAALEASKTLPAEASSAQGGAMAKLIRCECGFVARGDSDDQVVGMIRGHIATDHPALLETVSREDMLSWVKAE